MEIFEEFTGLLTDLESVTDETFEAILQQGGLEAVVDVNTLKNMCSIGLRELREQGCTYEEYVNYVAELMEEITTMRSIIEEKVDTASTKYTVLVRFVDEMEAAVSHAVRNNPYNHAIIEVQRLRENAVMPTFAHEWDGGADVAAVETVTVNPGETVIIPTGLKLNVPAGWIVSVRPRSGMSVKTGMRIANSPGTIDTGYLEEVGVIMTNTGTEPYTINAGDRIAQFIAERKWNISYTEVGAVDSTAYNRASENGAGFGSTGV